MSRLSPYQADVKNAAYECWNNGQNVVVGCVPTGGGKTVITGEIAREHDGYGIGIAHRRELISQISMALAHEGVRHDIIAPNALIKQIAKMHLDNIGSTFYNPRANWKIASVDTIIRRELDAKWQKQVSLGFQDEGHHVVRGNKWGNALELFDQDCMWWLPTATPTRADKKGLGRHASGYADAMVEGPNMRWMIENCYLVDYDLYAPTVEDFQREGIEISATTGELNHNQMVSAVKNSRKIIGDAVNSYKKFANGKLGITFAADVEHADELTKAYNAAGVPAVTVSANTPEHERWNIMRRFENRELLMLVNVDLFGEGVDVPVLEVVIFARPTASYALFVQQFGRVLRLSIPRILRGAWDTFTIAQRQAHIAASGKIKGIVIDLVGNIIAHGGPPDFRTQPWTLDDQARSTRATDGIPMRTCTNPECAKPYERFHIGCPYCGKEPPPPADRSRPENVDGDVTLYSPELLEQLFGERQRIDGSPIIPMGAAPVVAGAIRKNWRERQLAQMDLRNMMSLAMPPTIDKRIADKKFYLKYGVDTLTAQTLGSAEARALQQRIREEMTK